MIILDANVWIALFREDDSLHDKARKLFHALADDVIIPEYIFAEVCSVLAIRAPSQIQTFIDTATDNDSAMVIPSTSELFQATVAIFRTQFYSKLSFVDTTLLFLSRIHTIITFDKHLSRAIAAERRKNK